MSRVARFSVARSKIFCQQQKRSAITGLSLKKIFPPSNCAFHQRQLPRQTGLCLHSENVPRTGFMHLPSHSLL